ncbi:MAG: AAA family ATPase [Lachnospiraceae bacterium]|nr:AAA family ATPase [Lachnospiraceae bacterium]
MFVGRKKDLRFLDENFIGHDNKLLVIYGHKGVGKSSLMLRFAENKDYSYYAARPCSETEQLLQWGAELGTEFFDFNAVFSHINKNGNEKKLIIIDEFQNIIRYSDSFMPALIDTVQDASKNCMVILLSSSISFVETDFVPRIGSMALKISAFYKLSEMGFMDCVNYFKNYTTRQCMEVYSITGGMPAYWKVFDPALSVEENIINKIISPAGALYYEGERIISAELRELNVYSTILSCLSNGLNKLNELHSRSGFSRAKISVYLKNLMERELVEKVFPYDNASGINAKKGIYRPSIRLLEFYFRFMFNKRSALESMTPEAFYKKCVEEELGDFHHGNFCKVCGEYLDILNQNNMLPIKATERGEWVGKKGTIDIVMQDEEGESLLAFCDWKTETLDMNRLKACLLTAQEARLSPDHLYLFAAGSFSEELKTYAAENSFLKLVDIDTL